MVDLRAIPLPEPAGATLAEEVPVALVYDGTTHAVMMASPSDLADFALGFSLSEGIVATAEDIRELEIVEHGGGVEARMWLRPGLGAGLVARRRAVTGPVGCGLCGVESIDAALRPAASVTTDALRLQRMDLWRAPEALRRHQPLHDRTHAAHAAALYRPGDGLLAVREDVGRHNALDKLVGACAAAGETGAGAAVVLTSRVSIEMVQKAATLGAEAILALSAPTALAVRMAGEAGLTLIAGLKAGGEVHTHPHRVEA